MAFTVSIKRWHAVAAWTWNAGDDVCGICHAHYDGCPPDCKYPGDDSPVVWGACGHAFHIQCIQKWLASTAEQRCPMCRRNWEYKTALESQQEQPATNNATPNQQQEQEDPDAGQELEDHWDDQDGQQEQQEENVSQRDAQSPSDSLSSGSLQYARQTLEYGDDDMQLGES